MQLLPLQLGNKHSAESSLWGSSLVVSMQKRWRIHGDAYCPDAAARSLQDCLHQIPNRLQSHAIGPLQPERKAKEILIITRLRLARAVVGQFYTTNRHLIADIANNNRITDLQIGLPKDFTLLSLSNCYRRATTNRFDYKLRQLTQKVRTYQSLKRNSTTLFLPLIVARQIVQ